MEFQIRLRTDELFSDILPIRDWLNKAREGFAFEHHKPGNHHYHIYLFGISITADALRKTLGRYYEKSCYSVSTTAGKAKDKIIPVLAWQYGTEDKLLDPVWIKSFTEENIQCFKKNAEEFYASQKQPISAVLITREDHYVVRPDRVWERLKLNQMKYKDKTVREIKAMIAAEWINAGKAMPRPSDLYRYATSLYYLNKYDGEVPEGAMLEEFS